MREILRDLMAALDAGREIVYCRLVETRGSTPQKAGAAMLVFPDGSQAGTLGGGCVEAEVKRRALRVLGGGKAEIVCFQLDNDYGWDDGLICGGRMQILIDPLTSPASRQYFSVLSELIHTGRGCSEAVVFDEEKSGIPTPASYLFDAEDRPMATHPPSADAWLGSSSEVRAASPPPTMADSPPGIVLEHLKPLAGRPRTYAAQGIAYLTVLPRCRLLIVGGGHVGQAVGNLAADVDFDVWVVDDREQYVSRERFPKAQRLLCGPVDRVLREIEVTPDTYCLIVTRGHNHDEEALYHLADRGARYVGMIGSKRKIKLIFDDLLHEGVSPAALAKVYAPVGIDIGSQTVPEIAISILAELVAHRNLGGTVPGRCQEAMTKDGMTKCPND
jgi:xanthine dehydrogenase accessory factor